MGSLTFILSKIRKYEQGFTVVILVILLYLYLINSGYRFRKVDSSIARKPYIRSVNYQCAKSLLKVPYYRDPQIAEFIPRIKFKLYIIVHDEKSQGIAESWSQCAPWVEILRIDSTVFFESIAYKNNFPFIATREKSWQNLDYVGIATYKTLKVTSMEKLKAYLELASAKSYDVVPLMGTGEHLDQQAVMGHGAGFMERWEKLLLSMNYSSDDILKYSKIEVFLRNTYIIKPQWLIMLSRFMSNAIDTYQKDKVLQALFKQNAHYRESKLPVARKIFNQEYYEWHPFIFERLPCFFFHYYNASIFTSQRQVILFGNQQIDTLFKGL